MSLNSGIPRPDQNEIYQDDAVLLKDTISTEYV